jgi:hypothetical protein
MAVEVSDDDPDRPTSNREKVMEKLKSSTWFGRAVALQGMLGLVIKMSLNMQNVNDIPWELMKEHREFYDTLLRMEVVLWEKPSRESDPRWMSSPPEPISSFAFPFFHR